MGLELALLWLWQLMTKLAEKVEFLKHVYAAVGVCSELFYYKDHLTEKLDVLNKALERLSSIEEDVNSQLQLVESHNGCRRKREVQTWLTNTERKKDDVYVLRQRVEWRWQSFLVWLSGSLEKNIQEVNELCHQRKFFGTLVVEEPPTSSQRALLTTELVGNSTKNIIVDLCACITNGVTQIGIHGEEGIGKTAILKDVYNKLLDEVNNVFWVTAPENFSIHRLQREIAKAIQLDLGDDEEDIVRRAGKLNTELIRKGTSVLILDNLHKNFQTDKVGIPTQTNVCKLILGCTSERLCMQMGCWRQDCFKVEPLNDEEAVELFEKSLRCSLSAGVLSPAVEDTARQIVRECGGVPRALISVAQRMRGVYDASEWRDAREVERERRRLANS